MTYSVLTPYIIPESQKHFRKCNIGDGFILDAIRKLLPSAEPRYIFSTREPLSKHDIDLINRTDALIIAGANQLSARYTIVPGLTIETMALIKVPIVPFGVGITGNAEQCGPMTKTTKELLLEIHKRIRFSSWRCPRTVDYLQKELPEIAQQFLLTGCPVVFGESVLEGVHGEKEDVKVVAFTPTERGRWAFRDVKLFNAVRRTFSSCELRVIMQQDFRKLSLIDSLRHIARNGITPNLFYCYARLRGAQLLFPQTATEGKSLYLDVDLHVGTRLHAHLHALGLGKRSYLVPVDGRALGFSDYLRMPAWRLEGGRLILEEDLSGYRQSALSVWPNMEKFIQTLNDII